MSPRTAAWRSRSGPRGGGGRRPHGALSEAGVAGVWLWPCVPRAWSKPGGRAARCTAAPCFPSGSPQRPASTASTPHCWTRRCTSWRPGALRLGERDGRGRPGAAPVRVVGCGAAGNRCLRAARAHGAATRRRPTVPASATLDLFDVNQQRVARVGELRLRRATAEQVRQASQSAARDLYRIDWQAVVLGDGAVRSSQWAVLGDRGPGAGARGRGLRDGVGATGGARWGSGGPGAGNRRCAGAGRATVARERCRRRRWLRRRVRSGICRSCCPSRGWRLRLWCS